MQQQRQQRGQKEERREEQRMREVIAPMLTTPGSRAALAEGVFSSLEAQYNWMNDLAEGMTAWARDESALAPIPVPEENRSYTPLPPPRSCEAI